MYVFVWGGVWRQGGFGGRYEKLSIILGNERRRTEMDVVVSSSQCNRKARLKHSHWKLLEDKMTNASLNRWFELSNLTFAGCRFGESFHGEPFYQWVYTGGTHFRQMINRHRMMRMSSDGTASSERGCLLQTGKSLCWVVLSWKTCWSLHSPPPAISSEAQWKNIAMQTWL